MKKSIKRLIGSVVMIAAVAISVQMNKAEALSDVALENIDAIAMASGEGDGGCICAHVRAFYCCSDWDGPGIVVFYGVKM